MAIEWWMLAAAVSVILFMLISRSVVKPLRWIWYSLLYSAVGALLLFVLNLAAEWVEFRIPINPVTAFITGVLGLPGLVCLVMVKLFLVGG
ncbi:pro-sigmaK processing inhibitor BofA family protein [Kroppenstedtia eburnea]|uniref:Inhibitor of the pro-sigma K processing machinery n=1 Tax=Kroppenstedtia eburnea TaxID=714067 RepID=A0A1N7JER3_9BACL|nr:pro-sigmaK processing inhibitor BofA family protein [Kroppenstedtia eburnea]EGK10067.1 sigmaK-factor processing regulatory BofA [Desmospora sp. 8437]QKI80619.1 pro-sigmaK processing inhibitor BofA [Kroppenstedtia eburnea]SIS47790.1 inhibitor of the pro-sigma K processing machinery [Kroppenstedtia eburnea]